ncbi:MAG: MBL fold metallo-hydrolase, partial [Chromatocurvus sp.]
MAASAAQTTPFHDLPGGITCIDADYVTPGIACFYLVGDEGEYALIETGTNNSLGNLRRALDHLDIHHEQIRYIVPTHVHLDHAGAAGLYLQEFPHARLLVHPRGLRHLIDPGRLVASSIQVYGEETFAALYGEIVAAPAARTRALEDGDAFTVGKR